MNHYHKKLGGLVCVLSVLSMAAVADETYVFPAANQSAEQQKKDEYECYLWAVEQSGYDPVASGKAESSLTTADSDNTSSESSGAGKSMLGGAARGAVIAEVSDGDAGKGAATGATLGLMKGKRRQQSQQEQERLEAEERARAEAEAREKLVSNYQRANAACLEGRNYVIK